MKSMLINAIAISWVFSPAAYAQQLEMKGEAPKTTKQKGREELQRRRYWQEQARKKADEEKRLKAAREAEEQKRGEIKNYYSTLRPLTKFIIGTEDEETIKLIFNLGDLPRLTAKEELRKLGTTREHRLFEIAKRINSDQFMYIQEDRERLASGRTGELILPITDFSRILTNRVDAAVNTDELPTGNHDSELDNNSIVVWHRKRHDLIQSIVQQELTRYYQALKDQRKFKPFWRGATFGLGSIGNFAVNESTIQNILRRNYLYADANVLFWSFLRIGPYVAGDVQKGTLEKFGGGFDFVIGGPRAALLLGSRFGGARQHPIGSLRNAIMPSAGFELALGLPVALFFKYEAEFLQTDIEKFELNHQYNIGIRFRHYNDYFFSRGNLTRRQVSGNVFSD